VGNLLGANRPYAVRIAAGICVAMAVALMLAAGGVMLALRDRIGGLFTDDADATNMISSMIPFLAAFEVRCVCLCT
jgi:Na+-driven multidrug efflux pump